MSDYLKGNTQELIGYAVQLARVGSRIAAMDLRDEFIAKGYNAHVTETVNPDVTDPGDIDANRFYYVRVSPQGTEDVARELLAEVSDHYNYPDAFLHEGY